MTSATKGMSSGGGRFRPDLTAVITGASNGIGQAFAQRLAQDGIDVAICDLAPADETAALVEGAGRRVLGDVTCDITSDEAVNDFAAAVRERMGGCNILVHNAGIYPATPFLEMEYAEWRRVMDINLDSVFRLCKAFLPPMCDSGWGRIVSVSSTTFHSGIPNNTHYTASKGGLIGFSRSLAAEVGNSGVTVNTIAPGLVRTATTESGPQVELFDMLAAQQAISRTEEPSDLAGVLSFLVSEDAGFITGQCLVVDGGWTRT